MSVDVVLRLLVELDLLVEVLHLPVDARAGEAALLRLGEQVLVLALAVRARAARAACSLEPAGSLRISSTICCALCLPTLRPQLWQCCTPMRGVEHAQVVVHLGDGADRRARVVAGRLLLDGDGRGRARAACRTWASPSARGTAGRRRRGLDVAALAFRVEGVERERALALTRRRPVKTTSFFFGISSETFLRLCSLAPRTEMTSGSDMMWRAV